MNDKITSSSHDLLIGFVVPFSSGLESLKQTLKRTHRFVSFSVISACYASLLDGRYSHYVCVGRAQTELEFGELLSEIKLEEAKGDYKVAIFLLSYENVVRLDPEMTLPHPLLVQNHTVLQAASEAWGAFYHPVAQQSLDELKLEQVTPEEFDFIVSGRELIRLLK